MALGAGGAGALPLAYLRPSPWNLWVEGRYSALQRRRSQPRPRRPRGRALRRWRLPRHPRHDHRRARAVRLGQGLPPTCSRRTSTATAGWSGPYLSARIHENIYLDLRAAWGRSSNDVDARHGDRGFDTSRWLVKGTLAGNWFYGAWRFTPSAELAYVKESADAFANSAGTLVSGQDVALGRLQFGPEVGYRFAHTRDMLIEPFAAFEGRVGLRQPQRRHHRRLRRRARRLLGPARGRPHRRDRRVAGMCAGFASWDGVGASDYSGYTLQGTVNVPLN